MSSGSNPKDVATSFLEALNNEDLDGARGYLADNVSFMATDGAPVYGAEAYMNGWKKLGINYGINKAFFSLRLVKLLLTVLREAPESTAMFC